MKKLVFLLVFLAPCFSQAQKSGPDLSFGSNITTLNYHQEFTGGLDMRGGSGFSIRLNDKLSLRPVLNYQMKTPICLLPIFPLRNKGREIKMNLKSFALYIFL